MRVVDAFREARLDFVIIGNTAAALHGVPIDTLDIDVMVGDASVTERKLRAFAERTGMALTRPFESESRMVRAASKDAIVDFVYHLSSGRSFESIRSRAAEITVEGRRFRIGALDDIIESKRAAGRPKDLAALPILEATLTVLREMGRAPPPRRRARRQ